MSVWQGILATLKEIVQTALISLGIFFFVYIFLVQPHRIKGDSMLPNYHDGELLLTQKVSYRFQKPERGDVIVFEAPTPRKVDFIKRIVGLPRETVRIEDGIVYINEKKLDEPYETQKTQGHQSITLAENEYFVLGDNRGSSSDSRSFGPIKGKTIKGRVWLVYFPLAKTNRSDGVRIISEVNY